MEMPLSAENCFQIRQNPISISRWASALRPFSIMMVMSGVPICAWRASSVWMLCSMVAKVWSPAFAASAERPMNCRLVKPCSKAKLVMIAALIASRVCSTSSSAWRRLMMIQFSVLDDLCAQSNTRSCLMNS